MNSRTKKIWSAGFALGLVVCQLSAQSAIPFGSLPLWFEAGGAAQFIAHGSGSEFAISASGTAFTLKKSDGETASCTLQFAGANPASRIAGDQMLAGRISHLIGNRPDQWQAGLPTFARVRVDDVYPGVNVVYYGNQKTLEYDFNLATGVDPSIIALRFAGVEKISINPQGELVIKVNAGEIIQRAPVAYQMIHGSRQEVLAGYKILDAQTAVFALGNYDRGQPLVIDPVLSYSTYYGGNYGDAASAIAVNPVDGSIYVAGQTFSTKFTNNIPFSTLGSFQTNNHGGAFTGDAFVARFDNSGTNLIYATYLGGSGNDGALSLAVDGTGNAYLTGYTDSTNFPTQNALYNHIRSLKNPSFSSYAVDAFVTELNPAGNALVYSTYLGGNSMDAAYGIALDPTGNAYVTGYTYSTNFPVTPDAFQPYLQCSNTVYINANAFVAEIAAGGTSLKYSTYLGGTNYDIGRAIAFNDNRVFVAGYTFSTNFPCTNYLADDLPRFRFLNGNTNLATWNGAADAFVTAFDASATNLSVLYSTLLGGTNHDFANGIAADATGNAYVAGYTISTNFPCTATNVPGLTSFVHTNALDYLLATNGFLTQIKWNGTNAAIGYSAMFGGYGVDVANGVTLGPDGNVYVVGSASSTNFPATTNNISGYLSATNNSQINQGYSDAVVIAFKADGSALLYSSYLGGLYNDLGYAIAVDPAGNAYIAGQTLSLNFPAVNAYQSYLNGTNDMFIAKISPDEPLTLGIAPQDPAVSPDGQPGITLKWKTFPSGYELESSTNLAATSWLSLPNPVATNGWFDLTLPATNSAQFFRLQAP